MLFFIARLSSLWSPIAAGKFELDTKKVTCAAVAIAAAYALCCVSEHSNSPQLATANAIALIVIIASVLAPARLQQKPTKSP